MVETFRSIADYKGHYEISNIGRVKSLKKGVERILHQQITPQGYSKVELCIYGKKKTHPVHQLVACAFMNHKTRRVECGTDLVIDHIDKNPLNNKAENLRIVTHRFNASRLISGSSKYVGVTWAKKCNRWQAAIKINGKNTFLGYYKIEVDAHNAYQKALKDIYLEVTAL